MSKVLEEYFASWDPMGFIQELGAPSDEYSLEASTIQSAFEPHMSEAEVGALVYQKFTELMGHDFPGFREQCFERTSEIKRILKKIIQNKNSFD